MDFLAAMGSSVNRLGILTPVLCCIIINKVYSEQDGPLLTIEGDEIFYSQSITRNDGMYTFADCNSNNFKPTGINCTVITKLLDEGVSIPKKHCPLEIVPGEGKKLYLPQNFSLSLALLGNPNIVIITWVEESDWRAESPYYKPYDIVGVLDMSNCWMTRLQFSKSGYIPLDIPLGAGLVLYENAFDVMTDDATKCGSHVICRLSYDTNGNHMPPSPLALNIITYRISSISPESSDEGFFVLGKDAYGNVAPWEVDSFGRARLMKSNYSEDNWKSMSAISTSHKLFTVCNVRLPGEEANQTFLGCYQYRCNETGARVTLEKTLFEDLHQVFVFNLNGGGFMLVTKQLVSSPDGAKYRYNYQRNNGESKLLAVPSTLHCEGAARHLTIDFKEKDGRYCFYFLCKSESYQDGTRVGSNVTVYKDCNA